MSTIVYYCNECDTNISMKTWYLGYDHKFCSIKCRNYYGLLENDDTNWYLVYLYKKLVIIQEQTQCIKQFCP